MLNFMKVVGVNVKCCGSFRTGAPSTPVVWLVPVPGSEVDDFDIMFGLPIVATNIPSFPLLPMWCQVDVKEEGISES